MSNSKGSKKKSAKKKAQLSKKITSTKKSMPTNVTKKSTGKRKAKRKPVKVRKPSSYNIIQSGIKDYCLRKYGRRCSRKEVSEIYQALKLRYADEFKNPKSKITPKVIADTIDEKLGYKDAGSMPTALKDFEWYLLIDTLVLEDGGYFQADDVMIFDLTPIGLGKVRGSYSELEYMYTEQIYADMREYISDVEATTGIKMSPQPSFVLDANQTDEGKRVFTWVIDFDEVEGKEQLPIEEKGEKPTKEKKSKDKAEKAGVSEAVLLEREKTAQEKEKTKQAELKFKQDALDALNAGRIDQDTFKKLLGL